MPNNRTARTILKRQPAITFDDLAFELRTLRECLSSDTYPTDTDLMAARFIAESLMGKLKQTPHSRLEA